MSIPNLKSLLLVLASVQIIQQAYTAEQLMKTALEGVPFNHFQVVKKPCDEKCTIRGNCNNELGVCECPFGLTGPACETHLFPACRTTTTDPDAVISVGVMAPRNCHCYRQLLRAMCLQDDEMRCASHTLAMWDAIRCFEHVSDPEDKQISDLPDPLDKPSYLWRKGALSRDAEGRERHDFDPLREPPKQADINNVVPLSKCPSRCHDRGMCQMVDSGFTCVCVPGFTGSDCRLSAPSSLCPSDCRGRGRCVGGFCKCDAPFWGIGCSRSIAYEPVPGSRHVPYYPSLKIYMYDVPVSITGPQPFDDGQIDIFVIYQAFLRFMEMFLDDSGGIRTQNPYEANMFYIPAFAYYAASNLGDPTGAVVRAVDWAATNFPFFNRYQGKDHFVILTSDRGACYLKPVRQTENLIRLVHFGLERPNITNMGPLVQQKEYGCFKSSRDIVMAPYFRPKGPQIRDRHAQLVKPGGAEALLATKKVLFFFSGDVRVQEPEYSGGARQALSSILARQGHLADVVFKEGYQAIAPSEYEELLSSSKFCLAPYGHGWGIRLTHALMHACVPVVIQEKVRQPFEDLLHYPDFSVRISMQDLPRIVDILRGIPDEDVVRLMSEGSRIYRAFLWQPELGGLAYNYTIASLRRRLSLIRGELYEAGTRRR